MDLVDSDIKDAAVSIKDAKGCQVNNGGILNHTEGGEETESRIDKPSSLRMPSAEEELIKDARVPTVEEVGILNHDESDVSKDATGGILSECIHGLPGGKNCYLCDPNHPYRQSENTP